MNPVLTPDFITYTIEKPGFPSTTIRLSKENDLSSGRCGKAPRRRRDVGGRMSAQTLASVFMPASRLWKARLMALVLRSGQRSASQSRGNLWPAAFSALM